MIGAARGRHKRKGPPEGGPLPDEPFTGATGAGEEDSAAA